MPQDGSERLLPMRQRHHSLRATLKEKIVLIYDSLLSGEDSHATQTNFWDEFFILRSNPKYLQAHFEHSSWDELLCQKPYLQLIFSQSLLELQRPVSRRTANALQTTGALIRGSCTVRISGGEVPAPSIALLLGVTKQHLALLTSCLVSLICGDDVPSLIRTLAVNALLTCASACEPDSNPILEFLVSDEGVFSVCTHICSSPALRLAHGTEVCALLALLMHSAPNQTSNTFQMRLSMLEDDLVLNGFSYIISLSLANFNSIYRKKMLEPKGILYSLSNMVGSLLVGDEPNSQDVEPQDSLLLALFQALLVNRNFINTLTYSHTPEEPSVSEPTNLLAVFLEYCSIIMQDVRNDNRFKSTRLCFLILSCIAEDQYACLLMHDLNMNFRVNLHRIPMRHRRLPATDSPSELTTPAPLACALLHLVTEFVQSHLLRAFPVDLYLRACDLLHRLLCYAKRARARLPFPWPSLWASLFAATRYLRSIHPLEASHLYLLQQLVTVLNFCITFGDAFLPSPDSYDLLFYEIIRHQQLFDDIHGLCLALPTTEGSSQLRERALHLLAHLTNIRSITSHFCPLVEALASEQGAAVTQEQVLHLVRINYDSLTLRLQDSLDAFERLRLTEPSERDFFTQLATGVALHTRKDAFKNDLDLQSRFSELPGFA